MKKLVITSLLSVVISAGLFCQPPEAFSYQALVRNASGEVVADQDVSFRLSILNSTPGGTILYQETQTVTTNSFGLANLMVGEGSIISGDFSSIAWGADDKYLQVECDPSGGSSYVVLGTSKLASVPYALYSRNSSDSYWNLSGSDLYYNSGSIGLGTMNPNQKLEINGNNNASGFRVAYGSSYSNLYGEFIQAGSGGLLINSNAGGSWADISFQTEGVTKMFIEKGGNVGIGTTTPDIRLTVKSPGNSDVLKIISDADDDLIRLRQTGNNSGAIYLYDGAVSNTVLLYGGGNSFFNGGNVGIGTSSPNAPLHVEDRIRVGEDPAYSTVYGELIHEGGGTGFRINAAAGGGGWADLLFQTNGTTKMFIESAGNVGIGTTTPASRLDVQGNVTIRDISTGDIAIELGKGLDYAEGFDVVDNTGIEPGTVLCIDPEKTGKLKVSEKSYDKSVAGIVAGANGLGSGVRLGTQEFDCDVALAGRVYCNVVANEDDILPGDLLTTSSVPGFAMKVEDFDIAHGAILGKAMEKLEKGQRGQILVLVTLH